MHSYLFFLLLSSGVSSYFLPLKEIPHLQKETKHAGIDEILCLLKAENETIEGKFATPCHLQNSNCAHSNIEMFIQELQKIPNWKCMKEVKSRMQNLEETCNILKKSPPKDEICSKTLRKPFPRFIESLEEFLKWVNDKNCRNVGRSELGLYRNGTCRCHKSWKFQQALG